MIRKGDIIHNPNSGEAIQIASKPRRMTPEEIHASDITDLKGAISEIFRDNNTWNEAYDHNSYPDDLTHKGRVEYRKLDRQLKTLIARGIKPVAVKNRPITFNVIRGYAG